MFFYVTHAETTWGDNATAAAGTFLYQIYQTSSRTTVAPESPRQKPPTLLHSCRRTSGTSDVPQQCRNDGVHCILLFFWRLDGFTWSTSCFLLVFYVCGAVDAVQGQREAYLWPPPGSRPPMILSGRNEQVFRHNDARKNKFNNLSGFPQLDAPSAHLRCSCVLLLWRWGATQ